MVQFGNYFFKVLVVAIWFSNADSKGSPWDWQGGNAKYPNPVNNDDIKQEEAWQKHVLENGPVALTLHSNVSVAVGGTAQLPCRIKNLGEYTVSWLRGRDTSVLSVGHLTFSSSERFRVVTSANPTIGVVDWNLEIKDVLLKDAGWYDCQVNTSPKISNKSYLSVTEFDPMAVQQGTAVVANKQQQHDSPAPHGQVIPQIQEFLQRGGARAEISGPSVIHLPPGGSLSLECTITRLDAVPANIIWQYGEKSITPKDREGLSLESEKLSGATRSRLVISEVRPGDQGTYSCSSEGARPASVDLFIDSEKKNNQMASGSPRTMAQKSATIISRDDGNTASCQVESCQKLFEELQIKLFNIERHLYDQMNALKAQMELESRYTDSDGAEALASRVSSSKNPFFTLLILAILVSFTTHHYLTIPTFT